MDFCQGIDQGPSRFDKIIRLIQRVRTHGVHSDVIVWISKLAFP